MEKIPVHRILEFRPDTFEAVRKEHNLDGPGQMDAAIDILDDWVKKQAHFTKKDFREFFFLYFVFSLSTSRYFFIYLKIASKSKVMCTKYFYIHLKPFAEY